MKITQESEKVMMLNDSGMAGFFGGAVFFVLGIFTAALISNGDLLFMGVGAFFALIGAYMLVSSKMSAIRLEKGGKSAFSTRTALKNDSKERNTSDIRELELKKTVETYNSSSDYSSSGTTNTYYKYAIIFTLKGSEKLQFDFARVAATGAGGSIDEARKKEAKSIADFLGVPLK